MIYVYITVFILFMCMHMCLYANMSVHHVSASAGRGIASHGTAGTNGCEPCWVLGFEPESSVRAASAFLLSSPQPPNMF